jgi:hypothetical protein
MAEEFIWIITNETPQEGAREGNMRRNPYDPPTTSPLPTRRGVPVRAEQLEQGMTDFLQVLGQVFRHAQQRTGELAGMELDEVELAIEINGEGQVSLLGMGAKMAGKGAMTLKFKRVGS